jgi:hypothetical protein
MQSDTHALLQRLSEDRYVPYEGRKSPACMAWTARSPVLGIGHLGADRLQPAERPFLVGFDQTRSSLRHRHPGSVDRKPLASWTPLVAMISVPICARIDPLDPTGPPRSGDLHRPSPYKRYQDPPARRGGAGISTGRRTRQILPVSAVLPGSWWSRPQAEK